MAIERAAATANDTLDDTSDTLVVGLTLTPAADDYLLYATIEVLTASSAGSEITTFSVYVGGTRLDHTQRRIEEESSIDNDNTVVALNCKVSPNGSQAVEIRARTSGTASPLIAQRREMNLFPIPAGTDYEETATVDDTKSGSTFVTLGSMTRTPVSGDYLLVFSTTLSGPENQPNGANLRVSVGGSPLAHTLRAIGVNSSAINMDTPIAVACEVNPNGSQVVEIEWMNAGAGTVTAHERTMNLIPTASADIFEAQGTVDDTDSTTTDKQVDDMLITDPGADDYLIIFTAYDFYGVIGNNVAETVYSIRAGGTKVTDSDRMNEHEGSLDSCDLPAIAGGRVTVASATDDLQMYWQNGTTDTRTIRERTMVALREASAAPQTLTPAPVVANWGAPVPTVTTGPVTLTPTAVSAAWGIAAPIVIHTLIPASVAASWSVPVPTVNAGGVSITPGATVASWAVPIPTMQIGTVTLTPAAVAAAWGIPVPTVVHTITPAPVSASFAVPTPSLTIGGVTLTPPATTAAWNIAAPVLIIGGITLTPAATIGNWNVPTPNIFSGVTLTPVPVVSTWGVVVPTVQAGPVTLTPVSVSSSWAVPTPTVTIGGITITPAAVTSSWNVPAPSLAIGGITLIPGSITAAWNVPTATLLVSITLTPAPVVTNWNVPTPALSIGGLTLTPASVAANWFVPTATISTFLSVPIIVAVLRARSRVSAVNIKSLVADIKVIGRERP